MIYNPGGAGGSGGGSVIAMDFTAEDWTAASDGYTITVPASTHKLSSGNFVATIFHLKNGIYATNTWAAKTVDVQYDASGNVVLWSSSAFPGRIVFSG